MGKQLRPRPQVGVCSDWPVPVTLQLAGQLQWAIASGDAPPGAVLPTVERMASAVGLNRNTVNAVYTELSRQGLLELRRGTGTRVTDSAAVKGLQRRAPLLQLIGQCLDEAASLGFSAQEAAFLMLARAAWAEQLQRQRLRIGLVATPSCDASGFAAALAEVVGCAVETAFIEDLFDASPGAVWADWQVAVVRAGAGVHGGDGVRVGAGVHGGAGGRGTAIEHGSAAVREVAATRAGAVSHQSVPELPAHVAIVPVAWEPAPALREALTGLPPGAPVATVAQTEPTARYMRQRLVDAGFGQLRIFCGSIADSPLMAALPHMVQVWADDGAVTALREQHPGLTVRTYAWTLAADGAERLRETCQNVRHDALFRNLSARGTV